jgi:hypothetical protein
MSNRARRKWLADGLVRVEAKSRSYNMHIKT